MNLLYIDIISSPSHKNFNNIYLKNIKNLGIDIFTIFREGYSECIDVYGINNLFKVPNKLYKGNGSFSKRLSYIKILFYIKQRINVFDYDYIIMSSYEEISLFFSFYYQNIILINHNNLANLGNRLKRIIFKFISYRKTHVVFEGYFKDYCLQIGVSNVKVVSHGLPEPISKSTINHDVLKGYLGPEQYNYRVIFSPSSSSVDRDFIDNMLLDDKFTDFLEKNQWVFIVKGSGYKVCSKNVIIINNYLSEIEYNSLLIRSDIVLLSYPVSHKYRVSAVFFECVANNKLMIMSDIELFKSYENYIKKPMFFTNVSMIIEHMKSYNGFLWIDKQLPYRDKQYFIPKIESLFQKRLNS